MSQKCSGGKEYYKNAAKDENATKTQRGKRATYEEEVVCVVAGCDAGHPAPVPVIIVIKIK
jgi:hypothetical protein